MTHDPLCYMAEGKWGGGCQCPLIARVRADAPRKGTTKVAYAQGYLDALEATSWTCLDCGNTYDPDITECPNRYLDEAKTALKTAQRRAGE